MKNPVCLMVILNSKLQKNNYEFLTIFHDKKNFKI